MEGPTKIRNIVNKIALSYFSNDVLFALADKMYENKFVQIAIITPVSGTTSTAYEKRVVACKYAFRGKG